MIPSAQFLNQNNQSRPNSGSYRRQQSHNNSNALNNNNHNHSNNHSHLRPNNKNGNYQGSPHNKPGILAHQASLFKTKQHDSSKQVYQKQNSIGGKFIQQQQDLPEDNGIKILNVNKQQSQRQKNQHQLKIQLHNLDNELQKQPLIQRYDISSHALQKKAKVSEPLNESMNANKQSPSKRGGNQLCSSIKEDLNQSQQQLIKSYKSNKSSDINHHNGEEDEFLQQSWWQKCLKWCREHKHQRHDNDNDDAYSEGESDTEFETPYSQLTLQEQQDRMKYLWHRAFLKAKGAAHILAKFGELNKKIYLYGAARKGDEHEDPHDVMIKSKKCILMPDNRFLSFWNVIITLLLLYTATYVPFRIAFIDDNPTTMIIFDTFIDTLFFTDVFINFFSAQENKKVGIEVRHKLIAIAYMKSWFLLDILSCVPIQLMELKMQEDEQSNQSKKKQASSVKLLRLTRLPRLYRLVRIVRLFKMVRLFKQQSSMRRIIDAIKMNAGIVRMISVTITVFFLVHLVGCFWFLSAKLDDFNPDTWVVRLNYLDSDPSQQYLVSIYWALQTLTTVGFGDISAKTIPEKTIAILWMIFGVGFYSFTIGNLSQIIASIDTQSAILGQKLSILTEFAKRTNLPNDVMFRIRRHLENNNKHQNNLEDQEKLLNDLPAALRSEVVKHTHGEIIQKINFFREKDPDFLWAILPALRPIKLMPTDVLYTQGDHSDEIYFIKKGRIKLYIDVNENNPEAYEPLNIAFIAYVEGSYFGDSDIFFQDENKGRDSTAVADTECHLLVLSRKDLMTLGEDFEEMSKEMREIAKERKANHEELVETTIKEHVQTRLQENFKKLLFGGGLNGNNMNNSGIHSTNTPKLSKVLIYPQITFQKQPSEHTTINIFRATGSNYGGNKSNRSRSAMDASNRNSDYDQHRAPVGGAANMFSDAIHKYNLLDPSYNGSNNKISKNNMLNNINNDSKHQTFQSVALTDPSIPINIQEKLISKTQQVEKDKLNLELKQKRFREEYNETLVNFQNNMNFLSIHADEIQNMFVKYQSERQQIVGAMNSMKDQAQTLKQNSEFLKSSLDMILENMTK